MLGDTIAVTLGGTGGTLRTCNKINQDNYSAEYLDRSSTDEVRVKVRHSKENVQADGRQLDRHNVEVTQTVYEVPDTSPEYRRVTSFTFRHYPADTEASVVDLTEAVSLMFEDGALAGSLYGWES